MHKRVQRLGFDRGASDKLAGRPYDDSPPRAARGAVAEYRKFYRRGFNETRATAATGAFGEEIPVSLPEQPIKTVLSAPLSLLSAKAPLPAVSLPKSAPTTQFGEPAAPAPPEPAPGGTVTVAPPKGPGEVVADWLRENWKLVAAGAGVVVMGAVVYSAMSKPSEPAPAAPRRPMLPPPPHGYG